MALVAVFVSVYSKGMTSSISLVIALMSFCILIFCIQPPHPDVLERSIYNYARTHRGWAVLSLNSVYVVRHDRSTKIILLAACIGPLLLGVTNIFFHAGVIKNLGLYSLAVTGVVKLSLASIWIRSCVTLHGMSKRHFSGRCYRCGYSRATLTEEHRCPECGVSLAESEQKSAER